MMNNNQGQVVLVKDINPSGGSFYIYSYNDFVEFNDLLYFSADDGETGTELWITDGTTDGTNLVADINPGLEVFGNPASSGPTDFTEFNGKLYFNASDDETGSELWVTDGTTEGTQLVADINPGSNSYGYVYGSSPTYFTVFNGKLYFNANDGENGNELWVTDGTTEGTQLVADIYPGSTSNNYYTYDSSSPRYFTELNGKLYFTANDGENGRELWVTDGTTQGTRLVADIDPGSNYGFYPNGSYPRYLTVFNGKLYFTAETSENGDELWVTDGTTEGTRLVADINSGSAGSNPTNLTVFNGKLYFSARDSENGDELWVSDGTTEGTQLVADINSDSDYGYPNGSYPRYLTESGGKLYFTAETSENGDELWVSDGTTDGTQLVADINPGSSSYGFANSSDIRFLTELNGKLYFTAETSETGRELWVSDGTTEGTQLVANINPGSSGFGNVYGSIPQDLAVFDGELYFTADDGEIGRELYKLTFDDVVNPGEPNIINGTNMSDNLTGTDDSDIINGLGSGDTLSGGNGNDTLFGGNGIDELFGGAGDDSLSGEVNQDTIDGGSGNDTLNGGGANDSLVGGDGNDSLSGEAANDTLDGGDGEDTLFGGNGIDELFGGAGDDSLSGEVNQDTLDGGSGNDTLNGGGGQDVFVLTLGEGTDTITDFNAGQDSFELSGDLGFNDLTLTGNQIKVGDILIATVEGVDTSSLSASNFNEEEPTNPGGGTGNIEGTLGADTIEGTDSAERIKGLAGDDVINALGGDDLVFGDVGNDELNGGSGNDTIYGGVGNDTIAGGAGNDVLVGQEGNDSFVVTPDLGTDTIVDFDPQSDRLILGSGLVFEDLSFSDNSILVGDETLAILEGVDTTQLQADSFV